MPKKVVDRFYIVLREDIENIVPESITDCYREICPTYTVSELLYKLHEWIYPTIDGKQFSGGLKFCKDAPYYMFYYALKTKDYDPQLQQGEYNENYIYAEFEYPIESLASLLIQCHKKDIGMKTKDTGDISDK
jgi:hypothetical protein